MQFAVYLLMSAMIVYMMYRNVKLLKRAKHNRRYVEAYDAILKENPDAYKLVNDFLASEEHEEYINKGLLLKLLLEEDVEGEAYKDTLTRIDLTPLFFDKGHINKEKLQLNSDAFMWMILALCKAVEFDLSDVSDGLMSKLSAFEDSLGNQLEYHLVKGVYECLNDKGEGKFLSDLLAGEYPSFMYDKRMIGLYKRLAAVVLAYRNRLEDEYFQNDLYEFAKTTMGRLVMKALDLYDTYITNAEIIEDGKTEDVMEIAGQDNAEVNDQDSEDGDGQGEE